MTLNWRINECVTCLKGLIPVQGTEPKLTANTQVRKTNIWKLAASNRHTRSLELNTIKCVTNDLYKERLKRLPRPEEPECDGPQEACKPDPKD